MSTRAGLRTLIRLNPELTTTALSDVDMNLLLDRWTIDLALKGRAMPRNEQITTVTDQREYVVSGASPVLTRDDFLEIDLQGGGVLFNDGSRWIGPPEFEPKTREWLDRNYVNWRTNSSSSTPLYWYLDTAEDNSDNMVVGLIDPPSSGATDRLWIHYLSRGRLMTGDTQFPWTGSTTQLVHLEPYEILALPYVLDYVNRYIFKNREEADGHLALYLSGAAAMRMRFPLMDHLAREGFRAAPYFQRSGRGIGRGRTLPYGGRR